MKIVLTLILSLALVLGLGACNEKQRPPTLPEAGESREESESRASQPDELEDIIDPLEEAARLGTDPGPAETPGPEPRMESYQEINLQEGAAYGAASQSDVPSTQEPSSSQEEPAQASSAVPFNLDAQAMEQELLRLINEDRVANGVEPLVMEESMRFAARIRAPEVLQSLSHIRPDDTPYYTAFDEAGFGYVGKWHGENVSYMQLTNGLYDSPTAAAKLFETLKNSSGHYQNMLGEHFTETGIGIYIELPDSDMVLIGCAQLFASA